jgi:hypothetical protein
MELSVQEQRYQPVLAVISAGETVTDVAARFGVTESPYPARPMLVNRADAAARWRDNEC